MFNFAKFIAIVYFLISATFLFTDPCHALTLNTTSETAQEVILNLSPKEDKTGEDYLHLGWAYYAFKNNVIEALKNLEHAISIDKTLFEAYYLLGLVYKSRGDEEKKIFYWLKCLDSDRPETALVVHDILKSHLSQAEIKIIIKKLEELIKRSKDPLLKAHVSYCLATGYGVIGDLQTARKLYEKVGLITDWKIIGPFDNKDKKGFYLSYYPEKEINFDAEYNGAKEKVSWKDLIGVEMIRTVNFDSIYYPNDWVAAYALTYVYSDKGGEAAVRIGSDDAVKVWLNDRLIISNEKYQAYILDQHSAGVILHQGWNKILIKVCEGAEEWRFGMRITYMDGKPIENLMYSLEQKPYISDKNAKEDLAMNSKVRTIRGELKKKLKLDEKNYFTSYILAEWYRLLDLKLLAMLGLEELVRVEKKSAVFNFALADIENKHGSKQRALTFFEKTIEYDAEHVEALIQLAYNSLENKKIDEASQHLAKARQVNPENVDVCILNSLISIIKGHHKNAYSEIKRSLKKHPEYIGLLNFASFISSSLGKPDEAMQYFERIMKLNKWCLPKDHPDIVKLYYTQGKAGAIVNIYGDRIEYYKYDTSFYDAFIEAELHAGRYKEALNHCEQALKISPNKNVFFKHGGEAYYRLGMFDEAIYEWEKVIKAESDPHLEGRINAAKYKKTIAEKNSREE